MATVMSVDACWMALVTSSETSSRTSRIRSVEIRPAIWSRAPRAWAGADAVLLVVGSMDTGTLAGLFRESQELDLDAIVARPAHVLCWLQPPAKFLAKRCHGTGFTLSVAEPDFFRGRRVAPHRR